MTKYVRARTVVHSKATFNRPDVHIDYILTYVKWPVGTLLEAPHLGCVSCVGYSAAGRFWSRRHRSHRCSGTWAVISRDSQQTFNIWALNKDTVCKMQTLCEVMGCKRETLQWYQYNLTSVVVHLRMSADESYVEMHTAQWWTKCELIVIEARIDIR